MNQSLEPSMIGVAVNARIVEYCKRRGALVVGVADLGSLERIAPPGHRPSDRMPRVKSVISVGVGGQTQGAWQMPAKAMAYSGSTETPAYGVAYGCAFFNEKEFGAPAVTCRRIWIRKAARGCRCRA